MITYAQNFEDVLLSRLFSEQGAGFYIDIGASHPENLSITKHFYDLGWVGINVEPIPANYRVFQEARPRDVNINAAIDTETGERTFYEVSEFNALSTFDPIQAEFLRQSGYHLTTYPVKTIRCDALFEQYVDCTVDFLKIDVEGSEESVLRSLDLARFRPRVLLIEATLPARGFPGWEDCEKFASWNWESLVYNAGYQFAHFDGISRYYVRNEDAHLISRFKLPPGYFDDIHFATELRLLQQAASENASLTQQFQQATAENAGLNQQVHQVTAENASLNQQVHQVTAENASLTLQLQRATVENASLNQQVHQVTAENASLAQQLYALTHRGFRARVLDLFDYTQRRSKQIVRAGLWRIASGKPSPPLPKITIITPVFNGAAHIAETLESVLRQDYPALEYIVVDGGSTDGTLDIIRRYEARNDLPQRISLALSDPDQGMYDAIAKGFERAGGEIFCYLNADDLLECDGLRAVGEYFSRHPKAQVIYHEDVVHVEGWKYPNARQPKGVDTVDLLDGHILFQDGVFWRRAAYEAVGGMRRDLKLAGDFDLWLRLSAHFRFVRRPDHVSCFRVRPGQLSIQMERYHSEMRQSITDFIAAAPVAKRLGWAIQKNLRRVSRRLSRKMHRDRLFFPIDFGNMPPPEAVIPPGTEATPRSPIDGKPAERLLFSTPDTRFGERELNYIYLDTRHGIAITHPPIPADKLDGLYRKYYSSPPTELKLPAGTSPYRQFNGRHLWEKALLMLPVETLARFYPNVWSDNTLDELTKVLKASRIDVTKPLRFLDTGCFEGHLLDQIREKTPWQAFGLEPNDRAVETVRAKGHLVWHGHAEHAVEIVPQDQQFEVVFMGQSIEHVDDPVRVLRRLRLLLAPGGVLVMSTPNLDSREIDWFGPTWAHWHAPYHRYIFSQAGLFALARQVGLLPVHFQSFSHPYWTTMSIAHNWMGLGGSASHAVSFDRSVSIRALRIYFWHRLLWNRLGKGDYCFLAAKEGADE